MSRLPALIVPTLPGGRLKRARMVAVGEKRPGSAPTTTRRASFARASSQDPRPAAPVWGTPTRLPGIDRTEWTCVELTGANGKPIAVTDQPPSLSISADGRASGFAGVNRYFAKATVGNAINYDNVPLRFGPVDATRMAGPPERMALEDAFTSMLGGVRSTAIASGPRGAVLTLRNERGDCARFEPVRA